MFWILKSDGFSLISPIKEKLSDSIDTSQLPETLFIHICLFRLSKFETGLSASVMAETFAGEQLKCGLSVIIDAVSPVQ